MPLPSTAATADSAHVYTIADAAALPFEHSRFDLVVAYNVLMDVEDVPASLKEIRRVMRPGAELVLSLEAYAAALEAAGLAITSLREPLPHLADGQTHLNQWTRVPMFLWLKARPLAR